MPDASPVLDLKYGLNPQQRRARAAAAGAGPLPFAVLNGTPSVLNLLDAFQGWQLVRAAARLLHTPVAASVKHVSPAGVATAGALDGTLRTTFGLTGEPTPLATAYARARDCDPRSSYGDMVACSHEIDDDTARLLAHVVSDGVIAPAYAPGTVELLARKKRGGFLVLQVDPDHEPPAEEVRDVFGVRITQDRDPVVIDRTVLPGADELPEAVVADALLGLLAARHAQSNAVAYVLDGRTIGMGTGQQSRVDCVRIAGEKADRWRLRRHPELAPPAGGTVQARVESAMAAVDGVPHAAGFLAAQPRCTVVSDAYLPFADNVEEAARHGAGWLVEGGGSRRSDDVDAACRRLGITVVRTGLRLFHH